VPQGEEFFVYKVAEGAARRVPVKIGVRRDAKVEIVEGIAPGDQVVTAGMRLSRDGQPVRVLSPDAARGDAAKGGAAPARDSAGKG
jgi:membrane fusion protein (multidrug efflux system)